MFDFIVIGAGISGASVAYSLKQRGKRVLVIERLKIASGGSGAAGAFLSPKICSCSKYSDFINEAFLFSGSFYRENFSSFLRDEGILRILKSEEDIEKCKKSEISSLEFSFLQQKDIDFLKREVAPFGAYLFPKGALIDSKGVINAMLKDMEVVESLHVKSIIKTENGYSVEGYEAKGVIVCTGSEIFEEFEYIELKSIFGHRVDIKTKTKIPYHIHKECSISASKEGIVHIGATHIPGYRFQGSQNHDKELDLMFQKAKSYVDFDGFEIKKVHYGIRSSTFDFFPVVGELIDNRATLEKYPYIRKGSKVPQEKFIYHKNLFIHTGHGARGFVLAPFTAEKLCDVIQNKGHIEHKISPVRLFLKYYRK